MLTKTLLELIRQLEHASNDKKTQQNGPATTANGYGAFDHYEQPSGPRYPDHVTPPPPAICCLTATVSDTDRTLRPIRVRHQSSAMTPRSRLAKGTITIAKRAVIRTRLQHANVLVLESVRPRRAGLVRLRLTVPLVWEPGPLPLLSWASIILWNNTKLCKGMPTLSTSPVLAISQFPIFQDPPLQRLLRNPQRTERFRRRRSEKAIPETRAETAPGQEPSSWICRSVQR